MGFISNIQGMADMRDADLNTPTIGNYSSLGVRLGDKKYASRTRGAISRALWDSYLQNVAPIEDALANQIDNPEYLATQQQAARDFARRGAEVGLESARSRLESYGVTLNAQETAAMERDANLTAGLADVDAGNRATQRVKERELMLLSGANPRGSIIGA